MGLFFDDPPTRKAVPAALRRIVVVRVKGTCQICFKEVGQWDWELGHNKAASKGGKLTARNTFVVHSLCNRSQGNKSLKEFRKTLGVTSKENEARKLLKGLTIPQLRYLTTKLSLKVKGQVTEDRFFGTSRSPLSKLKYVNALSK